MTNNLFDRIRINSNPVASPESMVVAGKARVTVLTARLLRLEWSESGVFEDRGTFAFPYRQTMVSAPFQSRVEDGVLTLDTGALALTYRIADGPFTADNLSIQFGMGTWIPGMVNLANLRGTRRTLDTCAGEANLAEGLISRTGWSVFDDSKSILWTHDNTWIEPRPEHALQDWYFFGYGHDYGAALSDYVQFGGRIPLIPRFVLGAWWSRYWAYTDRDLRDLVAGFRAHDLPLDVLVIDIDWHLPGWTGYTWNRDYFPEPEKFLSWLHAQGLRTTLNLHPADGVAQHEEIYRDFAAAMGLDPQTGAAIPFRISDRNYVQHYFEMLHHPLEDQGVDFWWMDWQQGESSEMKGLDPLMWLNHLHFHDSMRRGNRPMLYSRWGGLGNHRYHIGFSGDTYATWDALAFQPYFTATASNVCYGWWSHDIGGHIGPTEPELYARWVQFGALSPCLRLHSTKDPLAERRPWAFPEAVFKAAQAAFQLRYALVPYLYTAAYTAAQTGISLCRPMYYAHPESESAYVARDQYYLGDQIIAAPIVHPADPLTGIATTDVWLPEGTWIDFQTKTRYTGPRWVRLSGDLHRLPMLVKAGGIIPMAPPAPTTDAIPRDELILSIFPGSNGQFDLYEDDGTTEAYRRGQCEQTRITTHMEGDDVCLVEIAPVQGHCDSLPESRAYQVRLEGASRPVAVQIDEMDAAFEYDPDGLAVLIRVPRTSKHQPLSIRVTGARAASHDTDKDDKPFIRIIEYTTLEDVRQQFGTVIVAHPAADSNHTDFPPEVRWQYACASEGLHHQEAAPIQDSRSTICRSNMAFSGFPRPLRWTVDVSVNWQDKMITQTHRSRTVFPAIVRWQAYVYNPNSESLTLADVLNPDGTPNSEIEWRSYQQNPETASNVLQPFGISLVDGIHPRVKTDEPCAAYAITTIDSPVARDAILDVGFTGNVDVYLNTSVLDKVAFTPNEQLMPMFAPWLGPRYQFYRLPLRAGRNTLVIQTTPSGKGAFWGIGAVVYDSNGEVLCE